MIADVKGPGAIVRLWSAAISGQVELFLKEPKVNIDFIWIQKINE